MAITAWGAVQRDRRLCPGRPRGIWVWMVPTGTGNSTHEEAVTVTTWCPRGQGTAPAGSWGRRPRGRCDSDSGDWGGSSRDLGTAPMRGWDGALAGWRWGGNDAHGDVGRSPRGLVTVPTGQAAAPHPGVPSLARGGAHTTHGGPTRIRTAPGRIRPRRTPARRGALPLRPPGDVRGWGGRGPRSAVGPHPEPPWGRRWRGALRARGDHWGGR